MAGPDGTRSPSRRRAVEPDHQLPPGRGAGAYGEPADPASLLGLVRSLAEDVITLMRQEIGLAKLEAAGAARRLAADGAWIGVGVAIAAVGALCLVLAMALGLGALLGSYWLGTLITGLVLLMLGGGFLFKGVRDLRKLQLVPKETTESLHESARWARERARDFKEGLTRE
jgi:hypothetical protein